MKKSTKFFLLSILSFMIAIALNDIEDTLVHHYDRSVFAPLGHSSYWYPDWTRKYVDGDWTKGRKEIWFIDIPAFFYDGWHLVKVIRQYFTINALALMLLGFGFYSQTYSNKSARSDYIKLLIYASILIWLSHIILYEELFIRG